MVWIREKTQESCRVAIFCGEPIWATLVLCPNGVKFGYRWREVWTYQETEILSEGPETARNRAALESIRRWLIESATVLLDLTL